MYTIEQNKSLKPYNTFGIDAAAKYYSEIRAVEDFRELIADKKLSGEKKLILGGGSNILFTKNYDGLVVRNCFGSRTYRNSKSKCRSCLASTGVMGY